MHSDKETARKSDRAEPIKLLGRIGSTTVEVTVHFSNVSKETMEDKLLRVIGREANRIA